MYCVLHSIVICISFCVLPQKVWKHRPSLRSPDLGVQTEKYSCKWQIHSWNIPIVLKPIQARPRSSGDSFIPEWGEFPWFKK